MRHVDMQAAANGGGAVPVAIPQRTNTDAFRSVDGMSDVGTPLEFVFPPSSRGGDLDSGAKRGGIPSLPRVRPDGVTFALAPNAFEGGVAPGDEDSSVCGGGLPPNINANDIAGLAKLVEYQFLAAVIAMVLFDQKIISPENADDLAAQRPGYTSSSDCGIDGIHKRMTKPRIRVRIPGEPPYWMDNPTYLSWRKKYKWIKRDRSREACQTQFVFWIFGFLAVFFFVWSYLTQRIFDA
eukprot:TRINITY_DN1267_c0_g1_i2.p1 TRINITY_DN1267_c0_g1~~TRINITY_DN1267_c0_g1_i2.p1  ORF type:complete len:238 (+),score=60.12 TRINITY_DN1267_c0_g1_i2:3-716(+)